MDYKYINSEYLNSVTGGEKGIMTEIINMFREQVVEFHSEMQKLLAEKQYTMLGMLAHKAKSSVAIMGMDSLALVLKQFELEAKEAKGIENYDTYIKKFGNDTAEAVKELDDLLNKMS